MALRKHKPLHKLTNAELAEKLNEVSEYSVLSDLSKQILMQAIHRLEQSPGVLINADDSQADS
jgi:hypothetical protein